jgi:hypothetical protein
MPIITRFTVFLVPPRMHVRKGTPIRLAPRGDVDLLAPPPK